MKRFAKLCTPQAGIAFSVCFVITAVVGYLIINMLGGAKTPEDAITTSLVAGTVAGLSVAFLTVEDR